MWVKIIAAFLLVCLVYSFYKVSNGLFDTVRLHHQGVVFMPYFPAVLDFFRVYRQYQKWPHVVSFEKLLLDTLEANLDTPLPAKCGVIFLGQPYVIFTKVEALKDVYLSSNGKLTKHRSNKSSFDLSKRPSECPRFKSARRSLQPALIRNKVAPRSYLITSTCLRYLRELREANGDQDRFEAYLDLVMEQMVSHIFITVLLGDCAKEKVKYQPANGRPVEEISLAEMVRRFMDDFRRDQMAKAAPMAQLLVHLGRQTQPDDRLVVNQDALQNAIRQRLVAIAAMTSESDKGLLCVQQGETDDMVEDVLGLCLQGIAPLGQTLASFVKTMIDQPDMRKRLRTELEKEMEPVKDNIAGKLTLDVVDKLDFLKRATSETLRLNPPFAISGVQTVNDRAGIGGVVLDPSDSFYVAIEQTHRDPAEWKEPHLFIPDRFDPESHHAQKPRGEKRNPFGYNPFFGGSRTCLGKTLAESILKLALPTMYHCFNFQHAEKGKCRFITRNKPQ